jgi:Domain of unknown function (DUF4403)
MRIALAALIVLSGCGADALAPSAPTVAPVTVQARRALPSLAPSIVDAPISYALEPMLMALEQAVPRRFGNIEQRIKVPSNKRQSFAFAATRTPFAIEFDGTRLTLSTVVSYEGRGWYDPPLAPTVSASCGTDGTRPRLRVVISTDVEVTPAWQVRSKTQLRSLRPVTETDRDKCQVTMFSIDVTDKVVAALRPQLTKRLPDVDRKIARFDLHTRVDRWYNLLNKSIRVRDSLWLMLAPEDVRLGGLRLEDTALVADVRLFARPTLISGARPANITTTLPAFMPARREVGDSSHLLLEGLLGYDAASAVIAKELVGRKFSRFGRRITVRAARFYPLGDGRVVLALGVDGAVKGDAFFIGTPVVDTSSRMLSVPDLDFDVATADALVRGLAWLKKADVVTELRKRARVPLSPILEETRVRVERALNRDLAEGVRLSGEVETGRILDVFADPRWLIVRAEATGSLGLGIDRELKFRKKRPKTVTDTATPPVVTK